jgi:hypothetical protein
MIGWWNPPESEWSVWVAWVIHALKLGQEGPTAYVVARQDPHGSFSFADAKVCTSLKGAARVSREMLEDDWQVLKNAGLLPDHLGTWPVQSVPYHELVQMMLQHGKGPGGDGLYQMPAVVALDVDKTDVEEMLEGLNLDEVHPQGG